MKTIEQTKEKKQTAMCRSERARLIYADADMAQGEENKLYFIYID